MAIKNNRIVVMKSDYDVMSSYLRGQSASRSFNGENARDLFSELQKAVVVNNSVFPKKAVRINSRVLVKEEKSGKILDITVVTPEKADIKLGKVSFMAPIGVALIGFKEGDNVKWPTPSGEKVFMIMSVTN